ncbi:hypothetical protein LUTEI9C_50055 [Luteimonas sp. 9C]|nr:hypothetical protein LUTEI9C_50055 [Luteimonas sp. 9C]
MEPRRWRIADAGPRRSRARGAARGRALSLQLDVALHRDRARRPRPPDRIRADAHGTDLEAVGHPVTPLNIPPPACGRRRPRPSPARGDDVLHASHWLAHSEAPCVLRMAGSGSRGGPIAKQWVG